MFTLFDLFQFVGVFAGLIYGYYLGCRYGIAGDFAGAVIGGYFGFLAGRLPLQVSNWFIFRRLRSQSTAQLWSDLYDEACLEPNHILLELRRRGEPMADGLDVVLSMMVSNDRPQRLRGLAGFLSAFPDLAGHMEKYRPDALDSERHTAVNELKVAMLE
ncbi:MAG: hypothetical protein ACRYFS_07220 [Janthinobacterium lividum]